MEKEANFVIFKINIISNLMNTISKRVKAELKPSKIESSKHVSKSFVLSPEESARCALPLKTVFSKIMQYLLVITGKRWGLFLAKL